MSSLLTLKKRGTGYPLPFLIAIGASSCLPAAFIEPSWAESFTNFILWYLLKAVVLVLLVFEIEFSTRILPEESRLRSSFKMALVGLVTGALSGIFVHIGASIFNLPNSQSLLSRIFTTGILSALWIAAIYWVARNYFDLAARKTQLLNRYMELNQLTYSQSVFLTGLRQSRTLELSRQAAESTKDLSILMNEDEFAELKPEQITVLLEAQIERLDALTSSIALYEERNNRESRGDRRTNWNKWKTWRENFKDFLRFISLSFSQTLVPPTVLVISISLTLLFPLIRLESAGAFVPSLLVLAVAIFGTQTILKYLRNDRNSRVLNILTIPIIATLIVSILSFAPIHIVGNMKNSLVVKIFIAQILVIVLTVLYHANRGIVVDAELFLAATARDLKEDQAKERWNRLELTRINKFWLQHIHGTMKSKAYAASLLVERAEATENPEEYISLLREARTLLSNISEIPEAAPRTRLEEINFRTNRWSGLVDILLKVDEEILQTQIMKSEDFADLIEEGITNAVRHGHCSRIEIEISRDEAGDFLTEIRDDGVGEHESRRRVGSALFEAATNGQWSRVRNREKSLTVLRLKTS